MIFNHMWKNYILQKHSILDLDLCFIQEPAGVLHTFWASENILEIRINSWISSKKKDNISPRKERERSLENGEDTDFFFTSILPPPFY